jgi:ankyrin repeat protein
MVKTRTVVQTRTHAQKYFQKLSKSAGQHHGNAVDFAFDDDTDKRAGAAGTVSASIAKKPRKSHANGGSDVEVPVVYPPYPTPGNAIPSSAQPVPNVFGGGDYYPLTQDELNPYRHPQGNLPAHMYSPPPSGAPLPMPQGQPFGYFQGTPVQSNPAPSSLPPPHGYPMEITPLIIPPRRSDIPQPSPAACGKRKHAELTAAQNLASGGKPLPPTPTAASMGEKLGDVVAGVGLFSASRNDGTSAFLTSTSASSSSGDLLQGVNTLSNMKDRTQTAATNKRPPSLGLSIVNPEGLLIPDDGDDEFGSEEVPGTPWDSQIRALTKQSNLQLPMNRLSRSGSISVSTPSEQKHFLYKIRSFIYALDLQGLRNYLAEAAASIAMDNANARFHADEEAKKIRMGRFSDDENEEEGRKGHGIAVKREIIQGEKILLLDEDSKDLGVTSSVNTTSSSVTNTNISTNQRQQSVAKLLNKDREKPLLLDVVSTPKSSAPAHGLTPPELQHILLEMVTTLVEYGASAEYVDTTNSRGDTYLHITARLGYEKLGKYFLSRGFVAINRTNEVGDTAVHIAARHGHIAFLEMLASLGANFHVRNVEGEGALDIAGYFVASPSEKLAIRQRMLLIQPRLKSLILYHEDFLEHTARKPSDWEGPDRLQNVMLKLMNRSIFPEHEIEISNAFEKADVTLLGRVHSPEYLSFVNDLSKQFLSSYTTSNSSVSSNAAHTNGEGDEDRLQVAFAPPPPPAVIPFTPQVQRHIMRQPSEELKSSEYCYTSFSSGTLNAARRAAGAVAHAVDRVLLGRNRNVFCAVRPPGHHAGYQGLLNGTNSCGFCIFNNVAAGAFHALEEHHCERVAIIDFDIHHGKQFYLTLVEKNSLSIFYFCLMF